MLTTGQVDHFRTFGFVVLGGFLADRAAKLRAETDAAIRDAYAATYDERVIDGISGHYLPVASRLTPVSVTATSPGDVIAFDLHIWHASTGGRDRLAWTAVYQRCPETEPERDRTLRSVHDGFEQAVRGFDTGRYPIWRDWLAPAGAAPPPARGVRPGAPGRPHGGARGGAHAGARGGRPGGGRGGGAGGAHAAAAGPGRRVAIGPGPLAAAAGGSPAGHPRRTAPARRADRAVHRLPAG